MPGFGGEGLAGVERGKKDLPAASASRTRNAHGSHQTAPAFPARSPSLRGNEPGSRAAIWRAGWGPEPSGQVGEGAGRALALFLGLVSQPPAEVSQLHCGGFSFNSVRRFLIPSRILAGNAQNHPSAVIYKAQTVRRQEGSRAPRRQRIPHALRLTPGSPHQASSSPMRTPRPGLSVWRSPDRNLAAA